MGVIVQRLPGDRVGDAIVSAVLTTTEAQLERGLFEVNTQDRDRKTVSGSVISSEFLIPGSMRGVDLRGKLTNGLLVTYEYTASGGNVSTKVSLETIK